MDIIVKLHYNNCDATNYSVLSIDTLLYFYSAKTCISWNLNEYNSE
jgi:hypothetical protein